MKNLSGASTNQRVRHSVSGYPTRHKGKCDRSNPALDMGCGPMIKFVAVVFGSYLLSVALVLVTDPLLSRIFPGDFVRGRVPIL